MKKLEKFILVLLIIIGLPIICTMVPTGPVKFMTVTGSSMEPTITESDIVVVNTAETQPEVGDIMSFRHIFNENQSFIVTHRVVKVVDGEYVTQGDAYSKPDGFIVAPEDVMGVMFFKIPYIGALVHFAGTIKGLLTLVILPALILIFQEVREIIGLMKKQK
ncbi:MAG: signal peptidase I [Methanosarcina sp.]|uniref:signal peptidase I n=1 Tax=Methanosarcina sp. TaxID=2213 RepID=UPI002618CA0B|nr:signal peptidase I [Methanosarcina sp.]MDD3248361.1 signal peptidase I [Methanosarcina sp.]MDD4249020.1 signal peptidase I [Methanosarcina sp.]